MKTQILEAGERSKNGKYIIDGWKLSEDMKNDWVLVRNVGWCRYVDGKYIIDGWKLSEDMKNDWVLVRNVGWCRYVDGLCAFYVPNVGWITR